MRSHVVVVLLVLPGGLAFYGERYSSRRWCDCFCMRCGGAGSVLADGQIIGEDSELRALVHPSLFAILSNIPAYFILFEGPFLP